MDDKWFEKYRKEFPVTERYIYLDHAGVAPVSRRVERAVCAFVKESAESGAFRYPEWDKRVDQVRSACAGLIKAVKEEIAFVRSTSHGLSLVAEGLAWNKGDNVIIYEKEFPSNIFPWEHLKRKGVEVRLLSSSDGRVLPENIEERIDTRTRLVSISSVQFRTGFRVDLERLGAICRKKGVFLCVDAIQSLGAFPMDVKSFNIDFLAADAHKWLLGPEGIGIFYCRKELAKQLEPPLVGWKSVKEHLQFENPEFELKTDALRFEEGSLNFMGIFGLGAAIELLNEAGIERIEQRVQDLGDMIIREAEKRGFTVLTPIERKDRGGNITVAGGFDPEMVRGELRNKAIMVNVRAGGLRISPHFYNTEEDIINCFREIDTISG